METARSILVMDDDEDVRFLVGLMLGKLGYAVAAAMNGDEAVRMYGDAFSSGRKYVAAILDLNIPGSFGGREVAAKILAMDPSARLFVSSGNESDPVMVDWETYGFSGRLPKPFLYGDAVALVQRIE